MNQTFSSEESNAPCVTTVAINPTLTKTACSSAGVANGGDGEDTEIKKLAELRPRSPNDPTELIKDGYLCRGGGALIVAPTGIGKSTFAMTLMIAFAVEKPIFGIRPTKRLQSLLIQAENDEGDLAEMRDGVMKGMGLLPDEIAAAGDSIYVVREDILTANGFFDHLRKLLAKIKPDILWIDPALAYLGGDSAAQKDVSKFCRNGLNPLLREFECGCFIIHHTNKPSKDKDGQRGFGSDAYLGSGSAEWANWARAVLIIKESKTYGVYSLNAGKRAKRLGWKDTNGKAVDVKYIAHATEPGELHWNEVEGVAFCKGSARSTPANREDLMSLVPATGEISKNELLEKWKEKFGNKDKGAIYLGELVHEGLLCIRLVDRSGTNPQKLIHRPGQSNIT